jgi:AcrR family transcriptional regulator
MEAYQKILLVATDLFRQYGFKAITMDEIARRGGISKKTLYLHFTSKPDVIKAAVEAHQQHIHGLVQQVVDDSENAVEAMVRTNAVLAQVFRQMNPISMMELQRFFPEAYSIFREQQLMSDVTLIRDNIIRGMEEGLYRLGMDADLLARYRLESCLVIFQPNSLVSQAHHPHLAAEAIMENFLYGLMTPKGEKLYQKYSQKYLNEVPRI